MGSIPVRSALDQSFAYCSEAPVMLSRHQPFEFRQKFNQGSRMTDSISDAAFLSLRVELCS